MSYIQPDARASYVHWWNAQLQTYALWFAYRHLNIPALDYVPRVPRRYTRWGGQRWIRPWDISTSGESSFRQNGYKKKVIDEREQARRDWRERKGFARDQAKGRCWCKCKLNDAKAGRRAWERDMIRKGRWEDLDSYDKNMFTDAWDCC